MSKIVQAVNAMISNPDYVTKVIKGEDEYFFLYRNKHKWSMRKGNNGEHYLWFYPGGGSLEDIASHAGGDWQGIDMIVYSDEELGTREARASFSELYTLIRERLFGVNKVLDEIIEDFP